MPEPCPSDHSNEMPQAPTSSALVTVTVASGRVTGGHDASPCSRWPRQVAHGHQVRSSARENVQVTESSNDTVTPCARSTTTSDLIVFGERGPIDNVLRFANEPARHKILDMIGDLSLIGADLCGHVVACHSGHPLNVELARTVHQQLVGAIGRLVAA